MKATLALSAVAVALVVAGCGSSDKKDTSASAPASTQSTNSAAAPSSSGGGGSALKVDADPSGALKFTKTSLSGKAGKVTITMGNPSGVPHGVGIEGNGVDKDGNVVNKGGTSTVSATLKPGKYEFYCPVPGHKEAGMVGTLTVK